MNLSEKAQLDKFIAQHDVEDVTATIRANKHSGPLRNDLKTLYGLVDKCKKDGTVIDDCNPEGKCMFLFTYYTDIFNRVKKDKLDRKILDKFINVLEEIENCEENQHTAAHKVGKYLKELYIDSALREAEKRSAQEEGKPKRPDRNITYTQFKKKNKRDKL